MMSRLRLETDYRGVKSRSFRLQIVFAGVFTAYQKVLHQSPYLSSLRKSLRAFLRISLWIIYQSFTMVEFWTG